VATTSKDGTIRIWNLNDWRMVEEIRIDSNRSNFLSISPSGKRILALEGAELQVYEPACFRD
jgi:WD40 repeat protein